MIRRKIMVPLILGALITLVVKRAAHDSDYVDARARLAIGGSAMETARQGWSDGIRRTWQNRKTAEEVVIPKPEPGEGDVHSTPAVITPVMLSLLISGENSEALEGFQSLVRDWARADL